MEGKQSALLIVGANPSDHRACDSALNKRYQLFFADNTETALDQLRTHSPQLIIYCTESSEKKSLSALKALLELTRDHMAIIIIVNEGQEKLVVQGMKGGVIDYLNRQELVPSILNMVIPRAIENKKWELLYHKISQNEPTNLFRDEFTELFNHTYFETRYREEIKRSQRYQFPISMLMITIHDWDQVKRKYGLHESRSLVKSLGHLLEIDLRPSDLVALLEENRLGILLPHTGVDQTRCLWERLHNKIRSHPFALKGNNYYIEVRASVTSLNPELDTLDAIIKRLHDTLQNKLQGDESLLLCLQAN